jgi:hypothetical protein
MNVIFLNYGYCTFTVLLHNIFSQISIHKSNKTHQSVVDSVLECVTSGVVLAAPRLLLSPSAARGVPCLQLSIRCRAPVPQSPKSQNQKGAPQYRFSEYSQTLTVQQTFRKTMVFSNVLASTPPQIFGRMFKFEM